MVAFIVVAVFLPEQVAQAVEYDWRVIWNRPAIGAIAPGYLKNLNNIDTALAIRNILKDIANKPVNAIKVSSNLTINLDKPLKMSNQKIDEITEWLKGKPCGSKALYDYLNYSGIKAAEGDIAIMALTVDILNDVVKPEGKPEVIKNSLYALAQAAKFFGADLYPVKVKADTELGNLTPFIAHLKLEHYILVTRVTEDKVYYSDEHKEEFLPKDTFLAKFSGYALTNILPLDLKVLNPAESKQILGARIDNGFTGSYAPPRTPPRTPPVVRGYGSKFAIKNGISKTPAPVVQAVDPRNDPRRGRGYNRRDYTPAPVVFGPPKPPGFDEAAQILAEARQGHLRTPIGSGGPLLNPASIKTVVPDTHAEYLSSPAPALILRLGDGWTNDPFSCGTVGLIGGKPIISTFLDRGTCIFIQPDGVAWFVPGNAATASMLKIIEPQIKSFVVSGAYKNFIMPSRHYTGSQEFFTDPANRNWANVQLAETVIYNNPGQFVVSTARTIPGIDYKDVGGALRAVYTNPTTHRSWSITNLAPGALDHRAIQIARYDTVSQMDIAIESNVFVVPRAFYASTANPAENRHWNVIFGNNLDSIIGGATMIAYSGAAARPIAVLPMDRIFDTGVTGISSTWSLTSVEGVGMVGHYTETVLGKDPQTGLDAMVYGRNVLI
ncbi:MAG: cysteine peptidase family C39 domain-containing protein, partial [Candidatus Omnitrophota bacterium]|nr:cysteine peptidase family C39 domain-containing protein [Candidatus Omnitrophota bacterium]